MKCAYHPDKEAIGSCGMCRKPLCEECGEQRGGADVLCSRCIAQSAAQAAAKGEDARKIEHEKKKSLAARKKKKPHVAMIVIVILAVFVMLANVYMFMGPEVPDVAQFDPDRHPLLTADIINEGVQDYAEAHGGTFPENLNILLGTYIPYEKITPSVLQRFSYRRFSPTAYELRFRDAKDAAFSDIVFGKEGN